MPDTRSTASSSRGRPDGRGRHVAAAARARGLIPVALARDAGRARDALLDVEIAVGDLEDAGSLVDPVRDIDAIIFVHGSDADSRQDSVQRIDYDGVLNTLQALGERTPRIVLRSSSRGGTTRSTAAHTHSTGSVDRSASSDSAARPTPSCGRDGSTTPLAPTSPSGRVTPARAASPGRSSPTSTFEALLHKAAIGKTFEVFSEPEETTSDWISLFGATRPDASGALDAIDDAANMPLENEPRGVQDDLSRLRGR